MKWPACFHIHPQLHHLSVPTPGAPQSTAWVGLTRAIASAGLSYCLRGRQRPAPVVLPEAQCHRGRPLIVCTHGAGRLLQTQAIHNGHPSAGLSFCLRGRQRPAPVVLPEVKCHRGRPWIICTHGANVYCRPRQFTTAYTNCMCCEANVNHHSLLEIMSVEGPRCSHLQSLPRHLYARAPGAEHS